MQPHVYYTPEERCRYASSRLQGLAQTNWKSRRRSHGLEVARWVPFKRWLLNDLRDPDNGSADAAYKLFRSSQKSNQRVGQYAAFLETIEHDVNMRPLFEDQRIQLLITGLTPALNDKLKSQPTIPNKMNELVSLLNRLEESIPKTDADRERGPRKRQRSDSRTARTTDSSTGQP